jgi:hypothetical protein
MAGPSATFSSAIVKVSRGLASEFSSKSRSQGTEIIPPLPSDLAIQEARYRVASVGVALRASAVASLAHVE